MNKKITVVVPIHNSEKYLADCISSVLNQTYTKLEILLVINAGNKEDVRISNLFAQTDARIKVLIKEKGSLSYARNVGIMESSGEYIMFLDSDDVLPNNYLFELVNLLDKNNSDVVVSNIFRFSDNPNYDSKMTNEKIIYRTIDDNNIFTNFYENYLASACNKLYKKSSINQMFDEDVFFAEDFLFNSINLIGKKIIINPNIHYLYRQSNNSTMSKNFKDNYCNVLPKLILIEENFKDNEENYSFFIKYFYFIYSHLKSAAALNKRFFMPKTFKLATKYLRKKSLIIKNLHLKRKILYTPVAFLTIKNRLNKIN